MFLRKCVTRHLPAASILAACAFGFLPNAAQATALGLFDISEEAHPGALLEVMYAHAEISYGQGKFNESLAMLDHILTDNSKHVPSLELKLSALRAMGNLQGVADTYQALMWVRSEREHVPQYAFECAMIYRQLGKPEVARPLFMQAIEGHFQEGAAHFFLGQIDLEADDPAAAQGHFLEALSSEPLEAQVRVASLYQLGVANLADDHPYFGNALVHDAQVAAAESPKDPAVASIAKTATKTLSALDRSQWFGSAAFMGAYDSNVAQLPSSPNASGRGVTQLQVNAGLGHVNSLLSNYQWLESLRFYGNLNFPNQQTAVYEYETLAPSLYLTHAPLARVPWGLKLEGDFTAQGVNGGGFRTPFLLAGDAGGFVKWRRIPREELELDAGVQPQSFATSDASGYSGVGEYVRFSWRREGSTAFWSPYVSANLNYNPTQDPNNAYLLAGASLTDSIRLGRSDRYSLTAGVSETFYSANGRNDITMLLHATGSHDLTPHLSLIADLSVTADTSTLSSLYSYFRAVVGAGFMVTL